MQDDVDSRRQEAQENEDTLSKRNTMKNGRALKSDPKDKGNKARGRAGSVEVFIAKSCLGENYCPLLV